MSCGNNLQITLRRMSIAPDFNIDFKDKIIVMLPYYCIGPQFV